MIRSLTYFLNFEGGVGVFISVPRNPERSPTVVGAKSKDLDPSTHHSGSLRVNQIIK